MAAGDTALSGEPMNDDEVEGRRTAVGRVRVKEQGERLRLAERSSEMSGGVEPPAAVAVRHLVAGDSHSGSGWFGKRGELGAA